MARPAAAGQGSSSDLGGLTLRAALLAVLLVVATYLGIIRLGFIRINWVPYVVPPVPALLFLVILYVANGYCALSGGLHLTVAASPAASCFHLRGAVHLLSMDRGAHHPLLHGGPVPCRRGESVG